MRNQLIFMLMMVSSLPFQADALVIWCASCRLRWQMYYASSVARCAACREYWLPFYEQAAQDCLQHIEGNEGSADLCRQCTGVAVAAFLDRSTHYACRDCRREANNLLTQFYPKQATCSFCLAGILAALAPLGIVLEKNTADVTDENAVISQRVFYARSLLNALSLTQLNMILKFQEQQAKIAYELGRAATMNLVLRECLLNRFDQLAVQSFPSYRRSKTV